MVRGHCHLHTRTPEIGRNRVPHRAEGRHVLGCDAGYPRIGAPSDDRGEQRIVVDQVERSRAHAIERAGEPFELISRQPLRPVPEFERQHALIRLRDGRHESGIVRPGGGEQRHLVASRPQPATEGMAVRFHPALEGFGDGVADMGENRDLHARHVRVGMRNRTGLPLTRPPN